MEQNYDSILHRLTQLEQRLEEGDFALPAGQTAQPERSADNRTGKPAEKISPEALPEDIRQFIERFPEIRRKMGGMAGQALKDASVRELPEHAGVQIILCRDYGVDEKELGEQVEQTVERMMQVRLRVQVSLPATDTRPGEPVIDLSKSINMDIDIDF